jgi:hypothetical protein
MVEIQSKTRVNLLHKLGTFHKVESESQADHDASVASLFHLYSHYSNEEILVKNCDSFYKLQLQRPSQGLSQIFPTSKVLHLSLQMTVKSSSQKPPLLSSPKIHSYGRDDTFQNLIVGSKWQTEAVKVALVAGLLCLQGCLPALAENLGLEVARSDQPIGFMSDLGDFQSGFTSVCTRSLLHYRTLA